MPRSAIESPPAVVGDGGLNFAKQKCAHLSLALGIWPGRKTRLLNEPICGGLRNAVGNFLALRLLTAASIPSPPPWHPDPRARACSGRSRHPPPPQCIPCQGLESYGFVEFAAVFSELESDLEFRRLFPRHGHSRRPEARPFDPQRHLSPSIASRGVQ